MNAIIKLRPDPYASEEARWNAVVNRARDADDAFWFAVRTTSVYCRPSCAARTPRRENVAFYDSRDAARKDGFRPCKRCRPDEPHREERHQALIRAACARIDTAEGPVPLAELATDSGLSEAYFHKLFKRVVGVTPRQYAIARRNARVGEALRGGESVTSAIYDAGFGGSSRFYEQSTARLGMTPREYRRGAPGQALRYRCAPCWLGRVLVAATERGVSAILLGDDDAALRADLRARFPGAELEAAEPDSPFAAWIDAALAQIRAPDGAQTLPLDVAGTAFQERVWRQLRAIPAGRTATYGEIAAAIGDPHAARAVARACAANPVAVVIPCHRVVRADGAAGGYRWGAARKQRLLEAERRG